MEIDVGPAAQAKASSSSAQPSAQAEAVQSDDGGERREGPTRPPLTDGDIASAAVGLAPSPAAVPKHIKSSQGREYAETGDVLELVKFLMSGTAAAEVLALTEASPDMLMSEPAPCSEVGGLVDAQAPPAPSKTCHDLSAVYNP